MPILNTLFHWTEVIVVLVACFLIGDTYYDGNWKKKILPLKKYGTIVAYGVMAIVVVKLLKHNPARSISLLGHVKNMLVPSWIPIDRFTNDLQQELPFDFRTQLGYHPPSSPSGFPVYPSSTSPLLPPIAAPFAKTKRSVSETKKRYVAQRQGWKCAQCTHLLDHTFEIDHTLRLEMGGSNEVDNLTALCRSCHGWKTAAENM